MAPAESRCRSAAPGSAQRALIYTLRCAAIPRVSPGTATVSYGPAARSAPTHCAVTAPACTGSRPCGRPRRNRLPAPCRPISPYRQVYDLLRVAALGQPPEHSRASSQPGDTARSDPDRGSPRCQHQASAARSVPYPPLDGAVRMGRDGQPRRLRQQRGGAGRCGERVWPTETEGSVDGDVGLWHGPHRDLDPGRRLWLSGGALG